MAVVTLQLGPYAGFVGAHWWQLQSRAGAGAELRADALHRAGRARDPRAPRLVLLDLRGSLGSLRRDGSSSRDAGSDGAAAWHGSTTRHQGPPAQDAAPRGLGGQENTSSDGDTGLGALPLDKDASQNACHLEGRGQVWSDYLRVHLHPRSIFEIQRYNHDGDSNRLEAFGQGESLLSEPTYLEELEDKLHFFIEECDYLQGFQILCDMHDGFSGVGAKVTELLCDEYSGRGILSWGLTPIISNTGDPCKDFYRLMNTVLGTVHVSSHSSLFCPLSLNGSLGLRPQAPITLPYIHYDASLNYHSSAILAAALETMTVPYRLHTSQLSMMQLAEALNFSGRKVVAAGAAVPFSVSHGHSLPDALCSYQHAVPWKPLSSCGEQKDSFCFAQSVVLRGIGKENHISNPPPGTQPSSALHVYETGEEVLGNYLNMLSPGTLSISHLLQSPCKVQSPYPQFFSPLLNEQGFLLDKPRSHSAVVESIPVLTALQSSPVLHTALYNLYKELQKVDVRRWASFFAAGVELDDFQEALHELRTLSQCYKRNSEPDESEDEADSD
ncbi:protein misato homolog 1 [Alligator mississippiensis]|uniref:protein misato homolog 1 n=1 Tax=Alligator mississippiensis TaxID=8496 RepID=UPI0028780B33|nr:protein misato homolog 1 [Alligator mississippiensis]